MAFQTLSLGGAITASQIVNVTLTPVTGGVVLPAIGAVPTGMGVPILLDAELCYVVQQVSTNVFTLRGRGSDGTAAVAHDILANVYASVVNDFGNPIPGLMVTIDPTDDIVISLGQDQTVAAPTSNTVYNINKASVAALTLSAPGLMDNGLSAAFTSNTAFAHVITAGTANNFKDGVSASRNTVTFAAVAGATVKFLAENGAWNLLAIQNVTLT